jgi:hypothetical protein
MARLVAGVVVVLSGAALAGPAFGAPEYVVQNCFAASAVGGCTVASGLTGAVSASPSPDGQFVYGAAQSGGITVYARTPSTGALTGVAGAGGCYNSTGTGGCTTFAALLAPFDVVFDPTDATGAYAYVVGNTGTLEILARNPATGAFTAQANCLSDSVVTCVTPVVGTNVLTGARAMVFSPNGANAYVASSGRSGGADDGITRFSVGVSHIPVYAGCTTDSGAGDCGDGAGLKGGTDQMAITVDGKFVYTTGLDDDAITVFSRNTTTGALTDTACYSATDTGECTAGFPEVAHPYAVLIAPEDQTKVYVGSGNGVTVLARDAMTGALSHLQCLNSTGADGCVDVPGLGVGVPNQLALSLDGTDLAVTESGASGGVVFLKRDTSTGLLSELPGGAGCITADGDGGACRTNTALGGISLVHAAPNASQFYLGAGASGTIAALGPDNPPVCANGAVSTTLNTAVSVPLSCTDPDGDALSLSVTAPPAHGGLGAIDAASRSVSYNPFGGFSGVDAFTFDAIDSHGLASAPAQDTVTVSPVVAVPKPGKPTATHASLTGVAKRRPKLMITLTRGSNAAALKTIKIGLPHGLSFSSAKKKLKKDVTVKSSRGKTLKDTAKVSRGTLTITLAGAATTARVTIKSPEIRASAPLARKVKHNKAGKLKLKLTVVDGDHTTTPITLKLKAS